jgi:hypothetical protein
MIADSVSSTHSEAGRTPDARSDASTWPANRGSASWWTDALTVAVSERSAGVSCQRATWWQTSSNTQAPSGRIRPVSSASGTNSPGEIGPSSACVQRHSASTPSSRPLRRSICGWYMSVRPPAAIAWRSSCSTSSRRSIAARVASEKTAMRFLPARLAWDIATSASPSSSCACRRASPPWPRATRQPMLTWMRRRRPPRSNGLRRTSTRRSATATASASVATCGHSTTNSSPPMRATTRSGPAARRRRPATSKSRPSPAAWPSPSLTTLKSSRSQKSTATWSPDDTAAARRSTTWPRVGRPVSSSRPTVGGGVVAELRIMGTNRRTPSGPCTRDFDR